MSRDQLQNLLQALVAHAENMKIDPSPCPAPPTDSEIPPECPPGWTQEQIDLVASVLVKAYRQEQLEQQLKETSFEHGEPQHKPFCTSTAKCLWENCEDAITIDTPRDIIEHIRAKHFPPSMHGDILVCCRCGLVNSPNGELCGKRMLFGSLGKHIYSLKAHYDR